MSSSSVREPVPASPGRSGRPGLAAAPPSRPGSACGCCVRTTAASAAAELRGKHARRRQPPGWASPLADSHRQPNRLFFWFFFTADGVLLISQQLDGDITGDGASAPVLQPSCCFLLLGWGGVLTFGVGAIQIAALPRVLSVTRLFCFFLVAQTQKG